MRTSALGCGAAVGWCVLVACSGERTNFSPMGDSTSDDSTSDDSTDGESTDGESTTGDTSTAPTTEMGSGDSSTDTSAAASSELDPTGVSTDSSGEPASNTDAPTSEQTDIASETDEVTTEPTDELPDDGLTDEPTDEPTDELTDAPTDELTDVCEASAGCECANDVPEVCNDDLACTQEVCDDGACSNPINSGFCVIDGQCYAANQTQAGNICNICNPGQNQNGWSSAPMGTTNPGNPCQICSDGSLVANVGVNCGSGPSECSAQDTCDANAVCQLNHQSDGETCAEGECNLGECEPVPFDCIAPDPPAVEYDGNNVFVFESVQPPVPEGGTVRDGIYTWVRIDVYGAATAPNMELRTYEFRSQYVQAAQYPAPIGFIPEIQFAGTFSTSNNTLVWDLDRCDPQYTIDIPTLPYTATANGLITFEDYPDDVTVVVTFARSN